jgi:hypothetical protein
MSNHPVAFPNTIIPQSSDCISTCHILCFLSSDVQYICFQVWTIRCSIRRISSIYHHCSSKFCRYRRLSRLSNCKCPYTCTFVLMKLSHMIASAVYCLPDSRHSFILSSYLFLLYPIPRCLCLLATRQY